MRVCCLFPIVLAFCLSHCGDDFGAAGGGSQNKTTVLAQAGMNFDLAGVRPFLERIGQKFQVLTSEQVDQLSREIAEMAIDEERIWQFETVYEGQSVPLRIHVFMDDVEAPDLSFWTARSLAEAIQEESVAFAEEPGW